MDQEQIKRKAKEYYNKGKEKAKKAIGDLSCWVENNQALAGLIVVGGGKLIHEAIKYHNSRQEKIHRDRDFYDPRRGTYTQTRRKVSNREALEIERRYQRGESYREILSDMGLVRRF